MTISIANRILLGFAFIVALMVGLGAYTINQLDDATTTTETIVTRDLALQRLLDLTARSQNEMRGAREEALSRFLLRSLGQPQGSHEELIADWGRRAASTESSLNQAIATTNNYLSSALTSQRADAWRRIGELLNRASGQLRQIPGFVRTPVQCCGGKRSCGDSCSRECTSTQPRCRGADLSRKPTMS